MFNQESDCESAFSVDSLEEEATDTRSIHKNQMKSSITEKQINKNMTIPYYNGEISIEEIKPNLEQKSKDRNVTSDSKSEIRSVSSRTMTNFKSNDKVSTDFIDHHISLFCTDFPRINSSDIHRLSRRKDRMTANVNSLKSRNRSVSYLEQFKKKMYGLNSMDASTYSVAGSDLTRRDDSLSHVSYRSVDGINCSSEYDYYENLIENTSSGQLTWRNEDILKSSTALTVETTKSPKKSKDMKKVKPKIILSKVCHLEKEEMKSDICKKNSIEKREVYANKIKLRNQLKINHQKQRAHITKLQHPDTSLITTAEDCFLQPFSRTVVNNGDYSNKEEIPYSINEANEVLNSANKIINSRRKVIHKTKKEKMIMSNEKKGLRNRKRKDSNLIELSNLQQRHEMEKSLVDSIRRLVLKA